MNNSNNTATKRLAKGTIVYMIGSMTSKLLQMLILPIITSVLTTNDYGYYDLVITTIGLVSPIITFQIMEGMFRFLFDSDKEDKEQTLSSVLVFLLGSSIILAIFVGAIKFVVPSLRYPVLIYLNYVSQMIFNFSQKVARCEQKNRLFAISGVVNTIVMLFVQVITLLVFHLKIDGMLLANCVSYFVAALYLFIKINIPKYIHFKAASREKIVELLKYSAPLIPNSIAWWIVASSDRYVITYFLTAAANGIYSIAGKFSQLLTFLVSVFQLAWQESAILEHNKEGRDKFYSDTFNSYMRLLMGGYLVVLPLIKLLYPFLIDSSYSQGYLYNPLLLIGAIFSAFSQFYGSAYIVFKKTRGVLYTTIVAALVNVIVGIGLIHWIGLFAPALGTTLAFGIQWVIRKRQLQDYFKVSMDTKVFIFMLLCMISSSILYYLHSTWIQMTSILGGTIIFLIVNKNLLISIKKRLFHK